MTERERFTPWSRWANETEEDGEERDKPSNRPPRGYVASRKNGAPMPWRREAERDFMHLLEAAPEVRSYQGRQESIAVIVDGATRERAVHFRVEVVAGDGKPHIVMADVFGSIDGNKGRLVDAVANHYSSMGIHYVALTEAEVFRQPRLGNTKAILTGLAVEQPKDFNLVLGTVRNFVCGRA